MKIFTKTNNSNGLGGYGTIETYYGAYIRLYINAPTFECQNNNDLYTVSSSTGNGALEYPIGLISLDEAWYAGGHTLNNISYYLYTGQNYWTMSPGSFYFSSTDTANVFYINSNGNLSLNHLRNSWGVRPVINLSSDVTLTGSGIVSDPYVVA